MSWSVDTQSKKRIKDIQTALGNSEKLILATDPSPVLWRKLPGARSAGRVQSVALKLITERETEIEQFDAREYWSVAGTMNAAKGNFPGSSL